MWNNRSPLLASTINRFMKVCGTPALLTPIEKYPVPADLPDPLFSWTARQLSESRYQMRINHTGEICAQALYAGHCHESQTVELQNWLERAEKEEYAHLQWCQKRLYELGSRPSRLDPLFYIGSFTIAKSLSWLSQSYNLRFIRETEDQVQRHLEEQIPQLAHDPHSCAIISQMLQEEKAHSDHAYSLDPAPMPLVAQASMMFLAKGMKFLVRYL